MLIVFSRKFVKVYYFKFFNKIICHIYGTEVVPHK
jgi:hypothetical protein